MDLVHLAPGDEGYPFEAARYLGGDSPGRLTMAGDLSILSRPKLGVFCSARCPGSLMLKAYDLAQRLREGNLVPIGGFHSPMEREWLLVLMRGPQPVILCPARRIVEAGISREHHSAIETGRLLLLSPFGDKDRRPTRDAAIARNRLVGAMASDIFVTYAEPGGGTEQLCEELLRWGKRVYTFDCHQNAGLISLGAHAIDGIGKLPWES